MITRSLVLLISCVLAAGLECPPDLLASPVVVGPSLTCFCVWAPGAATAAVVVESQPPVMLTRRAESGWWCGNSTEAGVGQPYHFVFNGSLARMDPQCQSYDGQNRSVVHNATFDWDDQDFAANTERVAVMEIHVPSFTDSGTLDAAGEHLQYLADLGITHVELMPVAVFRRGWNAWGYNPAGLFSCVMKEFGGYLALKRFVSRAHSVGLAVVLDVVFNHVDGGGADFNELYQFDGNPGVSGNGIYFYPDLEASETEWGPRPYFANETVANLMFNSVQQFVDSYHIDGFRVDSTVCIRKPGTSCWTSPDSLPAGWSFLQKLTQISGTFSTAEDDQGNPLLTQSVASGGAGFSSQWAYKDWAYGFIQALTSSDNASVNASAIASLLSSSTEGRRMLFTENHDVSSTQNKGRIPAQIDSGGSPYNPSYWACKKSMLGIAGVVLGQGAAMLLQGQEFLTYAPFAFPIPPKIDWALASANAGLVQEVRTLLQLNVDSFGPASIVKVVNSEIQKVIVLSRPNSNIVCAFNLFQASIRGFPLTNMPAPDGEWSVVFNGDDSAYSPLYKDFGMDQKTVSIAQGAGKLDLPEYSVVCITSSAQK